MIENSLHQSSVLSGNGWREVEAVDVPRDGDADVVDVEMVEVVGNFGRRKVEAGRLDALGRIKRMTLVNHSV